MTKATSAKTPPSSFSAKAFCQGLVAVTLIYACMFGWMASHGDKTKKFLEDRLASQAVTIQRDAANAPYNYPLAPQTITENAPPATTAPVTPMPTPSEVAKPKEMAPAAPPSTATPPTPVPQAAAPTGPLEPAPLQDLYEESDSGRLPKMSPNGLTPFNAYKRPYAYNNKPVIAIGVMDYGLSASDSNAALKLPIEASMVLTSYAANPEEWQKKARAQGHEVWLFLPMQNNRSAVDDPGPEAMMTQVSMPENIKRLNWVLGRTTGYVGIVAEVYNIFLDMHSLLEQILKPIFKRGLGFYEINAHEAELVETLALANATPYGSAKTKDENLNQTTMSALEDAAKQNGFASVLITPSPKNIVTITGWIDILKTKGFAIAPLSAVADANVPQQKKPDAASTVPAAPTSTMAPEFKPKKE